MIYIWVRGALPFEIKILGLSNDSEPFKHNQYLFELLLLVGVQLGFVDYSMVGASL
ncbi:hypothetical protein Gogos_000628, partial [Gossypium gossypioides]|nr:hypothetical protein [Gossypium gossypioides]